MVELLTIEKRKVLAMGRRPIANDFERAWEQCWKQMVREKAWPHSTEHRKQWREAMKETKHEMRAAFLDLPPTLSTFAQWAQDVKLDAFDLDALSGERHLQVA